MDQEEMGTGRPNLLRSLTGNINHFIALCYYVYVTRFSIGHQSYVLRENGFVPREQMEFFPGPTFRIAYLTHICEILQLVYFFWSCITDMVSASAPHSSAGRATVAFRDWFLAAIVFPIGSLVVITFWAIYGMNRELIFPAALDEFFPAWLNHALHTFVLPLLLIDMLLVKHKYPSRISGILGAVGFALCYLVWILYLGFAKDIWVYPFLKVLEGPYFILFFAVMTVVLIIFYIIGEKLSSVLGGSEKKVSTAKFD
ncbi:androgen-induced gene 1 protein-like isoform X3 [Apostichopus japonicus]|uniref:androgen-induced gene 1 protein-like isoform X3 n=1 Tax=Stichopus japonicus TaxID=307972 RepID=UPI003AB2AAA4